MSHSQPCPSNSILVLRRAVSKAPGVTPPQAALATKTDMRKLYAFYPLVPAITQTFGAIVINAKAQVLEPDGRVLADYHAAGNCAAPSTHDSYWPGGTRINCLVMLRRCCYPF